MRQSERDVLQPVGQGLQGGPTESSAGDSAGTGATGGPLRPRRECRVSLGPGNSFTRPYVPKRQTVSLFRGHACIAALLAVEGAHRRLPAAPDGRCDILRDWFSGQRVALSGFVAPLF